MKKEIVEKNILVYGSYKCRNLSTNSIQSLKDLSKKSKF